MARRAASMAAMNMVAPSRVSTHVGSSTRSAFSSHEKRMYRLETRIAIAKTQSIAVGLFRAAPFLREVLAAAAPGPWFEDPNLVLRGLAASALDVQDGGL